MTTYTIGFLVFDQVEEFDFIGPLEVFNTMNDIAARTGNCCANKTLFISPSGTDITGTRGMRISVDCALADTPELDVLYIPGGDGMSREIHNKTLLEWLGKTAPECTWIAGLSTGVILLNAAELTGNKKLATHWSARCDFNKTGFSSKSTARATFVRDGNLLTSSDVSTGIDMSLWLTGRLHSIPLALATQRAINHQRQPAPAAFAHGL